MPESQITDEERAIMAKFDKDKPMIVAIAASVPGNNPVYMTPVVPLSPVPMSPDEMATRFFIAGEHIDPSEQFGWHKPQYALKPLVYVGSYNEIMAYIGERLLLALGQMDEFYSGLKRADEDNQAVKARMGDQKLLVLDIEPPKVTQGLRDALPALPPDDRTRKAVEQYDAARKPT